MESTQDRYLIVLLSLDTLYSIKLNDLENCKLETVFSHLTPHKQPDGSSYPLGMGLFATHGQGGSKLHFFGGENLEDRSIKVEDRSIDGDLAYIGEYLKKRPKRPKQLSLYQKQSLYQNKATIKATPEVLNWLNKKVFSFTPVVLNDKQELFITTSTQRIPDHYGYKVRPIVVNMLSKIYVLSTQPFSTIFPRKYGVLGKQILFEVFDPKKGNWRRLPNPPRPLYKDILGYGSFGSVSMFHCVYKSKLLVETRLGTQIGHYLFDAISEKWKIVENHFYHTILACLEYKNFLLVFGEVRLPYYELVAYDLEMFGEEDSSTSREYYISIFVIEKDLRGSIHAASLSIVENNRICLVFNNFPKLHVYLFDVIIEPYSVKAERIVEREFDLPEVLFVDGEILSAFLFPKVENDVEESNQGCDGEPNTAVVKNLPFTIRPSDIRQEFHRLKFGEIKPKGIILNWKEHFAYVEFEDVQSLNKAIKASPINFAGKKVYIEKKEAVDEVSKMEDIEELDPLIFINYND